MLDQEKRCVIELSKDSKHSCGKVALVSPEDFDRVSKCKWVAVPRRNGYYALSSSHCFMHHFVLQTKPKRPLVVDHINGNGLDNRRENLRVVDNGTNLRNSPGWRTSSSKYKGVSRCFDGLPWSAYVYVDKKKKTIGRFRCEELAALAHDLATDGLLGFGLYLNFPQREAVTDVVRF